MDNCPCTPGLFCLFRGKMMECITYKLGYKYQLKVDYTIQLDIKPWNQIDTEFISLSKTGSLTIKSGYAWDGPRGSTIHTLNIMRASLIHDALYQLLRNKRLDKKRFRRKIDKLLRTICRKDGMTAIRAWLAFQGVKQSAGPYVDPAKNKPLIKAPKCCQKKPVEN